MRAAINKSILAMAISGAMLSPVANATNGYFSHGYSTKEKGLAGAGTAYSQDAMAAATNPAGMAFVGERMDLGLQLFSPSPRGYTVTGTPPPLNGTPVLTSFSPPTCNPIFVDPGSGACGAPFSVNPGSVDSENDWFLIPHFAYNWQLNSDSTAGVTVYGNGGMNTKYTGGSAQAPDQTFTINNSLPGPYGAGNAGVNLAQLFTQISFTRKINEKHAIGGGLILAWQRFYAFGLENFSGFSNDPANLSGNRLSDSFGAGIKIGYQGEVSDGVRVGASYQSRMSMSEFDEYKGLFAEGGDFDIPSTWNIGVSYNVEGAGIIVADIQRINYSEIKSLSNSYSKLMDGSCSDQLNSTIAAGVPTAASGVGCLGGSNGAGFGWEDMTIFKIGYQFEVDGNTYRVGYSHADQPVPSDQTLFNILAPAVVQDHFTAGMTMPMPNNQELNLAVMYAPSNSVKGANPFDQGATQIEIEMSQWDLQVGWAWKY